MQFFVKTAQQKYGGMPLISFEQHTYATTPYFEALKENAEFTAYVDDILDYGTIALKPSMSKTIPKSSAASSATDAILEKTYRGSSIMKRTAKGR